MVLAERRLIAPCTVNGKVFFILWLIYTIFIDVMPLSPNKQRKVENIGMFCLSMIVWAIIFIKVKGCN